MEAFPEIDNGFAYNYALSRMEDQNGLIVGSPVVDSKGEIYFTLTEHAIGTASIFVRRSVDGLDMSLVDSGECSGILAESTLLVYLTAKTKSEDAVTAPTFNIPESHFVVEGQGRQTVINFASNISEGDNRRISDVSSLVFITSVTSSIDNLFEAEPHISADGTLEFEAATHGRAIVQVRLQFAGNSTKELVTTKQFSLMVYPKPRVHSITPQIVPLEGGIRITVKGEFFGSQYSRGYCSPNYGNFSVFVGKTRCVDEIFVSDTEVSCLVVDGVGLSTVTFNISDGTQSRTGSLDMAVVHANMLYAGASLHAEMSGFVGFGPTGASPGSFSNPSASAADAKLNISRTVLAVAKYQGKIFAGGNFQMAAGKDLGHILSWNGFEVERIGRGLDGVVECMAVFDRLLVVGGHFTTALGAQGTSLRSGGLVGWNGHSWTLIGGANVLGIVTTSSTIGSRLYIAGRFRAVGNLEAQGLAFYDGISWQAVGEGSQVSGGLIFAMATLHGDLYVGGSLSKIGNTTVSRFAKWDGRSWSPIGSFNGDVHSIATDGESVLVGGDFTQVEDVTVRNIARYYSGRWVGVGGGLDGTVLSIRSLGSCLYVGGTFTSSFSADGQEMWPAKYLTRRCVSDDGKEAQFETFETFDTLGPVHVIQPFF
jgi:hypothetical protein